MDFGPAANYAAMGAAAGTAAGPIGTIVGGIGGGIYGLTQGNNLGPSDLLWMDASRRGIDTNNMTQEELAQYGLTGSIGRDPFMLGDEQRQRYEAMAAQFAGRAAPMTDQEMRARQLGSLDLLGAAARGEAPSVAEMQMRQGMQQSLSAQRAAAMSDRGAHTGARARMLADTAARTRADVNRQSAMLRAQEMAQARGALAQAVQGARGQDIGLLGVQQRQTAMNDAMVRQLMSMGLSADEANRQAETQRLAMQTGQYNTALDRSQRQEAALIGAGASVVGSVAGAAPAAAGAV